jgi:hypothetical protein
MVPEALPPAIKQPEHKPDHSLPFNTNNEAVSANNETKIQEYSQTVKTSSN